jgi:hypothetical protein
MHIANTNHDGLVHQMAGCFITQRSWLFAVQQNVRLGYTSHAATTIAVILIGYSKNNRRKCAE